MRPSQVMPRRPFLARTLDMRPARESLAGLNFHLGMSTDMGHEIVELTDPYIHSSCKDLYLSRHGRIKDPPGAYQGSLPLSGSAAGNRMTWRCYIVNSTVSSCCRIQVCKQFGTSVLAIFGVFSSLSLACVASSAAANTCHIEPRRRNMGSSSL